MSAFSKCFVPRTPLRPRYSRTIGLCLLVVVEGCVPTPPPAQPPVLRRATASGDAAFDPTAGCYESIAVFPPARASGDEFLHVLEMLADAGIVTSAGYRAILADGGCDSEHVELSDIECRGLQLGTLIEDALRARARLSAEGVPVLPIDRISMEGSRCPDAGRN